MYPETVATIGLVFALSFWLAGRLSSQTARLRLLDHPNERSLHATPMPRTGGLAILLSLALGLLLKVMLIWLRGGGKFLETKTSIWIVSMTLLLAAISLWDDWIELSPALRFLIHGLAAGGVVIGGGVTINSISLPLVGGWRLGWIAIPLTVVCLMWMINLYNFMDGMDGFAGGMGVIGLSFLAFASWSAGQSFIPQLAMLAVGATAGFLVRNWPPAKIFMGDVGSTLLGFLVGSLSVMGIYERRFDLWVPVLIFSPFIVDATATLIRRLLSGKKFWQPHREHYYQRLVLSGWSHRKTVLAEYCLMFACGLSSILYSHSGANLRAAILGAWFVIYCGLMGAVRMAEHHRFGPVPDNEAQ